MGRRADIVIPIYRDAEVTRQCIESVFATTGEERGQVILVNDGSPDALMRPALEKLYARHTDIVLIENERNLGFVGSVNRALELRQRDVVLLNSDTRTTEGWLTEMLEVAYLHDRIACVSPLSNNASICSVPDFWGRTRPEDVDRGKLNLSGLPRYTVVPTGVGFCMLLKDTVLAMIGPLDGAYGRGYNEENDWAMRARAMGFLSARANRAFVYHLGEVSFGADRAELDAKNLRLLSRRYPHFEPEVKLFCDRLESRVPSIAVRRQLSGLSACIDLRHMPLHRNGTHVYGVELARALKQRTKVKVTALVSDNNAPLKSALAGEGIEAPRASERDSLQVIHRPAQVVSMSDLGALLSLPAHAVITYQDLIAFRTPGTHPSHAAYREYRAASFASLQAAQAVVAISEHNRSEIVSEFGIPAERVHVVHHGVDTHRFSRRIEPWNERCLRKFDLRPGFLLNIGNDYPHKNVPLLLAAYARFRERSAGHQPPDLVLFGPATNTGGGLYNLPRETWLAPGVRYLGVLTDEEVPALYQEAGAFLFPSAYEGFGLPILEAMAAGTPVICSSLTSIPEVAGDACLYIRDFNVDEIARLIGEVVQSAELRDRLRSAGLARAKEFTWARCAERTSAVYEQVVSAPSPRSLIDREMIADLLRC